MRVFLTHENSQKSFSIVSSQQIDHQNYILSLIYNNEPKVFQYWIRKLNEHYFYSEDKIAWIRLSKHVSFENVFLKNKLVSINFGFLPQSTNESASGSLISKIPGKIIKVLVKSGQKVTKGEGLILLEAMKMENEIKAQEDGIVKEVHVNEGQNVESGLLLISMEEVKQ